MVAYSSRFKELRDEHLTFHIGDSCSWRNEEFSDYSRENKDEYLKTFTQIQEECGEFDDEYHSYLIDTGDNRIIPSPTIGLF